MRINRDLVERNYNIIKGIKGMTDTGMAERLHVHRSRIKAIIARPTLSGVECIAYALNVPIEFLESPIEDKTIREIESSRYHDDSGERP